MKKLSCIFLSLFMLCWVGCNSRKDVEVNVADRNILLALHNDERKSRHARPLVLDSFLNERAQVHAEWMADKDRLQHSKLGGTNFIAEGENIAVGQTSEEKVVSEWMDSEGHMRNILNFRFTHVGFGFARYSDGAIYWCAQFGAVNPNQNHIDKPN